MAGVASLQLTNLLPTEFGYTVIVVGLLCFHVVLTAYVFVVPVRRAVFPKLKENKEVCHTARCREFLKVIVTAYSSKR